MKCGARFRRMNSLKNKMNDSLWSFWNTAQPALAGLKAGEWALLLVLAASLLVLSALRERYLLIWTAGWALLAGSRLVALHGAGMGIPERYVPAVEQAAFVVAMGLFAGAVFVYIRERNLLVPLAAITVSVAGFAVARVLLWPDSLPLRVALEVSYRIILLTAAIALAARPPRPLGAGGMAAGGVPAGAAPELASFHERDSGGNVCDGRRVAGTEHASGYVWRSPRAGPAIEGVAGVDGEHCAGATTGRHDGRIAGRNCGG